MDLHQGWVRVSNGETLDFTMGRQKWNYGDQRLVGGLEWANNGRAFDGLRGHGSWDGGWFDGFWGRVNRFLQEDSKEVNRDLFGAYAHFDVEEGFDVEPYLLGYREGDESVSEIEGVMGCLLYTSPSPRDRS